MLLKQLRYDLEFSRFAFLLLGGILVSLAVLARVTAFMFSSSYGIRASVVAVIGVGVTIGVVVVQINKFFHSSLFGRFGYLALTLPITRGQLILSKLLAVGIWFNFFMAVNAVIVLVLAGGHSLLNTGRLAVYFTTYVHSAAVVFSLASVFLLNATLAHSTFGKMRVPGIVNTVATLVLILGYIYAIGWFTLSRTGYLLLTGRLNIGSFHINLHVVVLSVVMGSLALLIAHYLLKNRVSL